MESKPAPPLPIYYKTHIYHSIRVMESKPGLPLPILLGAFSCFSFFFRCFFVVYNIILSQILSPPKVSTPFLPG